MGFVISFMIGAVGSAFTAIGKILSLLWKKVIYPSGLYWWVVLFFIPAIFSKYMPTNSIQFTIWGIIWISSTPIAIANRIISYLKKEKVNILTLPFKKIFHMEGKTQKGNRASFKTTMNPDKLHGMFFGKEKIGGYVTKPENEDGNALIIGGAGSGKTSAIALPSLMCWKETILAIDIKGELYKKSKKARENLHPAIIFNPQQPEISKGYNPFYNMVENEDIVQNAVEIAEALIPLPADCKEPMWIQNAQAFLTGCIIFCVNRKMDFIDTMQYIKMQNPKLTVEEIMNSDDFDAKLQISTFHQMSDNTLSGIYAEVSRAVTVFATNKALIKCLKETDFFVPQDLENNDIFIQIEESMLETYKNLLTLMFNQFGKYFERRPDGEGKPILFLIDEFPRIGKTKVPQFLSTLRSKKIQFMLFVQSKEGQLDNIYGRESATITDNCNHKIILRADSPESQKWCSDLVGTADQKRKGHSFNMDRVGVGSGMGSQTHFEEKKIIKPEDFAYLQQKNELVYISPVGYKVLKKAAYFKDKAFKKYL